jgi:large subunit ribosomal protein L18
MAISKTDRRNKIKKRSRIVVSGTADRPRLTVFRSNKQIYAQLVNDAEGTTVASASSYGNKAADKVAKLEQAAIVGKAIGEAGKKAGVESVVFDRNGYLYHGRIKSLADAAREAGLKF